MEKRAKSISEKEIAKCAKGLKQACAAHGVEPITEELMKRIDAMPLFKE
jgi:hypothetical protein